MDCFKWYMKCIGEDYMSHLSVIKVKMRQLRAECEIAGIYYSSVGDNRTASKYLEHIMSMLVKNNFVVSEKGAAGGYRLADAPENFTVGQIVRAMESDFYLVPCVHQQ